MKAESYVTLLDGLLATVVYHPLKPYRYLSLHACWSVSLTPARETKDCISINTTPAVVDRVQGVFGEIGTRTSATPVCGYRLSLHA